MTREEARKAIELAVDQAEAQIAIAEKLATEHKITFDFSLGYGMGGTFGPENSWDSSGCYEDEESEWGWNSSSSQC